MRKPDHFDRVRQMWPGLCNYECTAWRSFRKPIGRPQNYPTVAQNVSALPGTPSNPPPTWQRRK